MNDKQEWHNVQVRWFLTLFGIQLWIIIGLLILIYKKA